MTSVVSVPHPLAACLLASEDVLGAERVWHGATPLAEAFFAQYPALAQDANALSDVMARMSSFDHEALNTFFAERGFPQIRFEPFDLDCFGVGAVLDLKMAWTKAGEPTTSYDYQRKTPYPAVEGDCWVYIIRVGDVSQRVGAMNTQNGYTVWMTLADRAYETPFEVAQAVQTMLAPLAQAAYSAYDGTIHFPMVDLSYNDPLKWILNASTQTDQGQTAKIVEAQQLTTFAMDHQGAVVKSAAKMGMMLECAGPSFDVNITAPFLLWITKTDGSLSVPVMSAYVDYDAWKAPT